MTANTNRAEQNAVAWAESISDYVAAADPKTWERLEELREERDECAGTNYPMGCDDLAELERLEKLLSDYESADDAREQVEESALCVELTGKWTPGEDPTADGFIILLSIGGPALRIKGELDQYQQPRRAWLEYQDWSTPWTEFHDIEHDTLLSFCSFFYLGE